MNAKQKSMSEIRITDLLVEDVMTRDFGVVKHDMPLGDVVNLILINDWEEILITDELNKYVNIATKKTLLKFIKEGADQNEPVSHLCKHTIITAQPKLSLIEAREIMRRNRIGRLPIVDGDDEGRKIAGILTSRDVCNGFSSRLEMIGEHMYSIMENISEAIQVIDCSGVVTYWNYSAEKMFKIPTAEISGRKLADFFPEDLSLKVLDDREGRHDVITRLEDNSYIVRNAVPVVSSAGEMIGVVCTSKDVTHTKNLIHIVDRYKARVMQLEHIVDAGDCSNEYIDEKFYTVNPETLNILKQAARVAASDATVLITGESGTGKELLAKYIYRNSRRKDKPFVEINCGAIPEALFESEMFGYESGAFTGASKSGKPGKFELAKAGTLFLDEIGELPLEMQSKFLRVIQEKNYYRVGGKVALASDVRIVAATNRDLVKIVEENIFRKDLFYRLSVVMFEIPPLRKRKEDIPGLIQLFVNQLNFQYGRTVSGVDPEVIELMTEYSWPGNVRQLSNAIERIFILCEDDYITMNTLFDAGLGLEFSCEVTAQRGLNVMPEPDEGNNGIKLNQIVDSHERSVILEVLRNCNYNKSHAAQILGIPRSTLYYKLKALDIDAEKNLTFC